MARRGFSSALLSLLILAGGCVERDVPRSSFACTSGGPCYPDAEPASDALGPRPDAAPYDGGVRPDGFTPDVPGGPDADPAPFPAPNCLGPTPLSPQGVGSGVTSGAAGSFHASCGAAAALAPDEAVFSMRVPGRLVRLVATTQGSSFDTVLSLMRGDCGMEVTCADEGALGNTSLLTATDLAAGDYYFIIDGYADDPVGDFTGPFVLAVEGQLYDGEGCDPAQAFLRCARGFCPPAPAAPVCTPIKDCADGIDNDEDGSFDEDAPSCAGAPTVQCPGGQTVPAGVRAVLTASLTGGGPVVDREWRLVVQPPVAATLDGRFTDQVGVQTVLAGEHRLRFTAIDALGQAGACEVTLVADTVGAFRTEMYWVGPTLIGAPNLHILNAAAAAWFDVTNDCDPTNCFAPGLAWGAAGAADDPVLVASDDPPYQYVRISNPPSGASYRVGVAYDVSDVRPAEAFVRVHCGGQVTELGPVQLAAAAADPGLSPFWKVADVTFTGAQCTVAPLTSAGGPLVVTVMEAQLAR